MRAAPRARDAGKYSAILVEVDGATRSPTASTGSSSRQMPTRTTFTEPHLRQSRHLTMSLAIRRYQPLAVTPNTRRQSPWALSNALSLTNTRRRGILRTPQNCLTVGTAAFSVRPARQKRTVRGRLTSASGRQDEDCQWIGQSPACID